MEECREQCIKRNRNTTGFFVDHQILEKAETEDYQTLQVENLKVTYSPAGKGEMHSPVVDFVLDSEREGKNEVSGFNLKGI